MTQSKIDAEQPTIIIIMLSNKWTWALIGLVSGYMLANRLDLVPVVNRLPKL